MSAEHANIHRVIEMAGDHRVPALVPSCPELAVDFDFGCIAQIWFP